MTLFEARVATVHELWRARESFSTLSPSSRALDGLTLPTPTTAAAALNSEHAIKRLRRKLSLRLENDTVTLSNFTIGP